MVATRIHPTQGERKRPICNRCKAALVVDRNEWRCLNCGPVGLSGGPEPVPAEADPYDQLIAASRIVVSFLERRCLSLEGKRTGELNGRRKQLQRAQAALVMLEGQFRAGQHCRNCGQHQRSAVHQRECMGRTEPGQRNMRRTRRSDA